MDTRPIVDISEETLDSECVRRDIDKRRWQEVKKYIPFLKCITEADPIKNDKYVQLLHWLQTRTEFPARVSNMCENTIRKRYEKLKSSMVFPQHVIDVFTKIDFIEISDSEDDEELMLLNKNEMLMKNNVKASIKSVAEDEIKGQGGTSVISPKADEDSRRNAPKRPTSEEGEILSDNDEAKTTNNEMEKYSMDVSLHDIPLCASLKRKDSDSFSLISVEEDDDAINQDLFDKIDSLVADSTDPKDIEIPEWKQHEKKDKEAHLRSGDTEGRKNNIEPFQNRISPLKTAVNEEENQSIPVNKKKKKKHKHKKKDHSQIDKWCLTEVSKNSEKHKQINQKIIRINSESENLEKLSRKKQKKHKKKQGSKISRALLVSDDEDQVAPTVNIVKIDSPKTTASDLFSRREKVKDNVLSANDSNSHMVVVEIPDSDDEQVNKRPNSNSNETQSAKEHLRYPVLNVSTSPTSDGILSLKNGEVSNPTTKNKPNTAYTSDINNMELPQLNDIYLKLCQTTGIQLEELLKDLEIKSQYASNSDKMSELNHEIEFNNKDSIVNDINFASESAQQHEPVGCVQFEQQQFQLQQEQFANQHQLQQQQIQIQHQIQQQMHQQQILQQQSMQTHCNMSIINPYQNSLRHGLNLNDPRIMRILKQIKDSPVHNMNIRDSANAVLINYSQSTNRPTVQVNSKNASTYGEHKRLRELEKQKELERLNAKKSAEVSSPEPTISAVVPSPAKNKQSVQSSSSKSNKAKLTRNNSSSSECDKMTNKTSDTESEGVVSGKTKRRTISSSSLSEEHLMEETDAMLKDSVLSGRMTPKELKKVVGIVLTAIGKSKETVGKTLENLSSISSKSRRKSRRSTDSTKSEEISSKHSEKDILNDTAKNESTNMIDKADILKESAKNTENNSLDTEKIDTKVNPKRRTPKKTKLSPGCRELNNLNCTFKDYHEMFDKCSLPTIDGKRRCNAQKTVINRLQLDSDTSNSESDDQAVYKPKHVDKAAPIRQRRKTCSVLQRPPTPEKNNLPALKVVIRRLSVSGTFGVERKENPSDDTDEFDIDEHTNNKLVQEPIPPNLKVKLRKLSFSEIRKSVKQIGAESLKETVKGLNPKKQEVDVLPKKATTLKTQDKASTDSTDVPILVPIASKPIEIPVKKSAKLPKTLNIDINMTFTSTKFCAICNKRPGDLTNHYVIQHKTESYISRLTTSQIDNLEKNVPLALAHRKKYMVECAFCQEELEDYFVNFHAHYSFHTGEYGFKCEACEIVKPYREDVRCHQHRSSRCRNSKIRTNYLYSADLRVIYLYVCKLCNFVQLNEANIHKHHRDHHSFKFDEGQHIKKIIIAALNDGEVINEVLPSNPEEESFEVESAQVGDNSMDQEQKFIHEYPLDIKDVILAQEDSINQSSSHSQFCGREQPYSMQKHNATTNEPMDEFLNLPKENPSPESYLAQLYAPQSMKSVITVVHCGNEKSCQETHQPFMETVERKPNIAEIKIEPSCTLSSDSKLFESKTLQPKACLRYRTFNLESNYFGLYKCTQKDCWFSTNVADRFVKHTNLHFNEAENVLLTCAYCAVKSSNVHKLVRHIRSQHSMSRFQCSSCSYRSMIPGNVIIHRKICHRDMNSDKQIFECAGRVRNQEEKVAVIKKKMIESISSLKCPECPSVFYAVSSIESHMHKTHPNKLISSEFNVYACVHCKEESNSRTNMQTHLATEHPDFMGYVVKRDLKSGVCEDRIENLNLINISLPILPTDIHPAPFVETSNDNLKLSSLTQEFKELDTTVETEMLLKNDELPESPTLDSYNKDINEEQIILERIGPLLELLTENTGINRSNLYPCKKCKTMLGSFDLWLTHAQTLHNVTQTGDCPHCTRRLELSDLGTHFESHLRQTYICYYCITCFSSEMTIREHFAAYHANSADVIEKVVAFGNALHCIVKKGDDPVTDWLKILPDFTKSVRRRCIQRLERNTRFEWWEGLSLPCLEEIEFPQCIVDAQRFKCLVKSCSFVSLNQNDFDLHLNQHTVPESYSCDHCALYISTHTWEQIKNHDRLHKENLHICTVCKFVHVNRSEITKHIEKLHNSRDVPVISLWMDAKRHKISLSIVLPPKCIEFTTSRNGCFCCGKEIKQNLKFKLHLRVEHNICLCPKCELCGEILLTPAEMKAHAEEHGDSQIFRIKFDVLTTYLYTLTIKSMSPIVIETKLKKEKRANEESELYHSKRPKMDDELPYGEEVIIKKECDEDENDCDLSCAEKPSCSIKCVNINELVQNEPLQSNETQRRTITVKSTAELQIARPVTENVPSITQYQHSLGFNNHQSQESILPYSFVNVNPSTVLPSVRPNQLIQRGPPIVISTSIPNRQHVAAIPRSAQTYILPGSLHSYRHPQLGMNPSQQFRMRQNTQLTLPPRMTQPILQDQFRSGRISKQ